MDSFSSYHNGGQEVHEEDFEKLTQTIGSSIQKISQNVSSMQRMVNQIGTPQDSPELKKQLHAIQHYTQRLVKDTNQYIKDLTALPLAPTHSVQRQRKMQRERLQDEYTATLNTFQATQRNAMQKERDQVRKAKDQVHIEQFSGLKRDPQLIELQDSGSTRQQQMLQEEIDLRALQEQEQSIRQLESDINDVNQIFKELGQLIHEQGETVDSIEASVERTHNYVGQGVQQLKEASTYKSKIRKKKFIIGLIIAIILVIVITIIIVQTS